MKESKCSLFCLLGIIPVTLTVSSEELGHALVKLAKMNIIINPFDTIAFFQCIKFQKDYISIANMKHLGTNEYKIRKK